MEPDTEWGNSGQLKWAFNASSPRALVLARAGDPLMKEGRARLIWAANTADALAQLGFATALAATRGVSSNPLRWLRPVRRMHPPEAFRRFYAVRAEFEVLEKVLPFWLRSRGANFLESGNYETGKFYANHVLPRHDLIHTRDWRVAEMAVRRGVATIYEDHHESFNEAQRVYPRAIVEHPAFRTAVAISSYVGETMVSKGIPAEKLIVEDSGVSADSLEPADETARQSLRQHWLNESGCASIVAYSGGLHAIRGIELLLQAAHALPGSLFLVAGGRGRQVREWTERAETEGLRNVRFLGYLPQSEVPVLLQSADVLALPYLSEETAPITSPLKFFEYLAAARPVAACLIPSLERFAADGTLRIHWSQLGSPDSFTRAIQSALEAGGEEQLASHRRIAADQTWKCREARILVQAGIRFADPSPC